MYCPSGHSEQEVEPEEAEREPGGLHAAEAGGRSQEGMGAHDWLRKDANAGRGADGVG